MTYKYKLLLWVCLLWGAMNAGAQTSSQPLPESVYAGEPEPSYASEVATSDPSETKGVYQEQQVDVAEIVFGHIGDAYEWHITDIGSHALTLPLPILVRSTTGWHCFLSSRFHEGEGSTYEGLYIAPEGAYKGKVVERVAGREQRPMDLSLTKNVVGLLINSLVLLGIVFHCVRWYRRHPVEQEAPGGLVGMVEACTVFLRDEVIAPCIGPDYRRYQPYLLTVFFFILVSNLMGLLPMFPGGVNLTGNIAVTMVLALCTFVAVNLGGNRHYWKEIFWPDVPWWLKVPIPLMPFIELFGIFTKPLALMIRLFANIMAGHAAILSLLSIVFITAPLGAWINGSMGAIAVVFGVFMTALELLVAFIQAYVFTLLSAVFIGLSRPQEEN